MRYFLQLSYLGKGIQRLADQPNAPSVQQTLQQSLGTLLRRPVETVGAGRTDTGVHASFYVVHFDTEAPIADPEDFCYHLNALLPYDIAVQRLRRVRNDAHARFDALEREYKYYISPRKNPFNRDTAYQLAWPLDLCRMNEAAAPAAGRTGFHQFLQTALRTIKRTCAASPAPDGSGRTTGCWYSPLRRTASCATWYAP